MGKTEPLMEAILLHHDSVRQPGPYCSISHHSSKWHRKNTKLYQASKSRTPKSYQTSAIQLHTEEAVTMWLGIHYANP